MTSLDTEHIYVVHYTKLKDRYANIEKQRESLNISNPVTYISEFDQEELTDDVLNKYYNNSKEKYEDKVRPLWDVDVHSYRELNKPELSCTIKHIEAVGEIAKNCKEHGLILEDDAVFKTDFISSFNNFLSITPEDWDVILMGEGCGNCFINDKVSNLEPHSKDGDKSVFKMPHPATNCAEAYLIKSEAAKNVYKSSIPFNLVSDWELGYQFFKFNLNVYWWLPSLVLQGSKTGQYSSTLDQGQRR